MDINQNSTPLSSKKLSQNSASIEGHSNIFSSKLLNKYNIILGLSIITFIAAAGFWIYTILMI